MRFSWFAWGFQYVACSSVGRTPGYGPEVRRFESVHAPRQKKVVPFSSHGLHKSRESSMSTASFYLFRIEQRFDGVPIGRVPESGQTGRSVNPLAFACVCSNPNSPNKHKYLCEGGELRICLQFHEKSIYYCRAIRLQRGTDKSRRCARAAMNSERTVR